MANPSVPNPDKEKSAAPAVAGHPSISAARTGTKAKVIEARSRGAITGHPEHVRVMAWLLRGCDVAMPGHGSLVRSAGAISARFPFVSVRRSAYCVGGWCSQFRNIGGKWRQNPALSRELVLTCWQKATHACLLSARCRWSSACSMHCRNRNFPCRSKSPG